MCVWGGGGVCVWGWWVEVCMCVCGGVWGVCMNVIVCSILHNNNII